MILQSFRIMTWGTGSGMPYTFHPAHLLRLTEGFMEEDWMVAFRLHKKEYKDYLEMGIVTLYGYQIGHPVLEDVYIERNNWHS